MSNADKTVLQPEEMDAYMHAYYWHVWRNFDGPSKDLLEDAILTVKEQLQGKSFPIHAEIIPHMVKQEMERRVAELFQVAKRLETEVAEEWGKL